MSIISGAVQNAAYAKSMADKSQTEDDYKLSIILDIPGLTREYLLARHINFMASFRAEVDSTIIESFNMLNPCEETSLFVENIISKFNMKQSYIGTELPDDVLSVALEDTAGNSLTLGELIANNNGNALYIDMWSLGCGPCRFAMPYSKQLSDELNDKGISFIYITQDREQDSLWNQVYDVTLTKQDHYRFVNGNNTRLHKLFEIFRVPNYMIIDKKGALVQYSAESPVDHESKMVNQNLKDLLLDL